MPKTPGPRKPKLAVVHHLDEEGLRHANELGGLAAPSLAVVHKDHGLEGFGNITLVAHPDMVDPKQTPVFASDVYSPRHPKPNFKVDEKKLKSFVKEIEPNLKATGHNYGYDLADTIEESGVDGALRHRSTRAALQHKFLDHIGKPVEPEMREAPLGKWSVLKTRSLQDFFSQHGVNKNFEHGDNYHQAFSEAMRQGIAEDARKNAESIRTPDDTEEEHESYVKYLTDLGHKDFDTDTGLMNFASADHALRFASRVGKVEVDPIKTKDKLNSAIEEHGEHHFENWALDRLKPIQGEPYIPKISASGRRRKIPYNIDNVLKEMVRKVRAGESFHYGLGTVRSMGTKKFRSYTDVTDSEHKLVPKDEFEKNKELLNDRFAEITEKLGDYHESEGYGFGHLNAAAEALGESFKRGRSLRHELKRSGFNPPEDLVQELRELGRDLLGAPTEYFEAKPQRVVRLGEFHGAVVPEHVSDKTLQVLKEHGIQHIRKYPRNDHKARYKAVGDLAHRHELLLSEDELEFEELSKSDVSEGTSDVSLVLVTDGTGRVLMGRRRDNGCWTLPGGHLDEGEAPEKCAERELFEETGLKPYSLSIIKVLPISGGTLYCYSAAVSGDAIPTSLNDPDQECEKWEWVDARGGLPQNVWDNLHGPKEHGRNVVLQAFELKRSERVWLDAGFADLSKGIDDVPSGRPAKAVDDPLRADHDAFDYSDILTPEHRSDGYSLKVLQHRSGKKDEHSSGDFEVLLHHPSSKYATGNLTGFVDHSDNSLEPHSSLEPGHRGRGLGKAMYEAAYRHARDFHGATTVRGNIHSDDARRVHESLARKHGFEYNAKPLNQISTLYPNAPYSYVLKDEEIPELDESQLTGLVFGKKLSKSAGAPFFDDHEDDPYVYHVTYAAKLPQITEQGLIPQGSRGVGTGGYAGHSKGHIFVTNPGSSGMLPEKPFPDAVRFWANKLEDHAAHHSDNPESEGLIPTVLRVHTDHLDRLDDDEAGSRDAPDYAFKTGAIQPHHLEVLHEGVWKPLRTDMQKSESGDLLSHPDPVERGMSLKLNSATPRDISRGVLDPHSRVWWAAFNHPDFAAYAHGILAHSTRDSSGRLIFDRHDALLNHPGLKPYHVEAMYHATKDDVYAPEHVRVERLRKLSRHHMFPRELALQVGGVGLPVPQALAKAEKQDRTLYDGQGSHEITDHTKEQPHPHVQGLYNSYRAHVQGPDIKPQDENLEGLSNKVVYNVPHEGGHKKLMVKPYYDRLFPESGWAEETTQALYHAAGIGHLHQQVFSASHGYGPYQMPATVVHIEPATHIEETSLSGLHPDSDMDAKQIALMDFAIDNPDRHGGNLMVRSNGRLMAIDHGASFGYPDINDSFINTFNESAVAPVIKDTNFDGALQWWQKSSSQLRETMKKRLEGIRSHKVRQHMQKRFEERADFLDRVAEHGSYEGRDWMNVKVHSIDKGE